MAVSAWLLAGQRSESGPPSAPRQRPCFLSHRPTSAGGPRGSRRPARRPRAEAGRSCISPAEPGPGHAPAAVPIDTPVLWAGDRGHDIESVRVAVIARPAAPRASGVLYLDPEAVPADFGAQGERAAGPGGAVQTALAPGPSRARQRSA